MKMGTNRPVSNGVLGTALIFSHVDFPNREKMLPSRDGNSQDVERLQTSLTNIGFNVINPHTDLTTEAVKHAINYFGKCYNFKDSQCLMVIVMSHGSQSGVIYSNDGQYYTSDIWEPFKSCPTLQGKPKIFIFQACRGNAEELIIEEGRASNSSSCELAYKLPKLPHHPEYFIAFSTVENYTSLRDKVTGTWYIQTLCNELDMLHQPIDLFAFMTQVTSNIVTKRSSNTTGQTPSFVSFLHKPFILPASKAARNVSKVDSTQQNACSAVSISEIRPEAEVTSTTNNQDVTVEESLNVIKESANLSADASTGCIQRTYSWDYPRRGKALVYYTTQNKDHANKLEKALKYLQFNPQITKISQGSLTDELRKVSTERRLSECRCLLVVVLAPVEHCTFDKNQEECFINVQKASYPVSITWSHFVASRCRSLINKPKMFFYIDPHNTITADSMKTTLVQDRQFIVPEYSITEHADFLYVYGYGKHFVDVFCNQISSCMENDVDMLTMLLNIISQTYNKTETVDVQQHLSHFESTLQHQIIFQKMNIVSRTKKIDKTKDKYIPLKRGNSTQNIKPIPDFCHRSKELEQMKITLQEKEKVENIDVAITGMPGVGKSQLALKFVEQNSESFDRCIVIPSENQTSIIDALVDEFDIPKKFRPNKNSIFIAIHEQLLTSHRYLLIFDNLTNEEDVIAFLPSYSNTYPNNNFVVTTSLTNNIKCNLSIKLDCFDHEESLSITREILDSWSDNDCTKLASMLGNHPLTIQLAGLYINHQNTICTRYRGKNFLLSDLENQLVSDGNCLYTFKPQNFAYKKSLQEVWENLKSILLNNKHGKLAITILEFMAYLNYENIPQSIIKIADDSSSTTNMLEAIYLLERFSLISVKNFMLTVNTLFQEIVRQSCKSKEEIVELLLHAILQKVYSSNENKSYFLDNFMVAHAAEICKHAIKCKHLYLRKLLPVASAVIASECISAERRFRVAQMFEPNSLLQASIDINELNFLEQYVELLLELQKYELASHICKVAIETSISDIDSKDLKWQCYNAQCLRGLGKLDESYQLWLTLFDEYKHRDEVDDFIKNLQAMWNTVIDINIKHDNLIKCSHNHTYLKILHDIQIPLVDVVKILEESYKNSIQRTDSDTVEKKTYRLAHLDMLHYVLMMYLGKKDPMTITIHLDIASRLSKLNKTKEAWSILKNVCKLLNTACIRKPLDISVFLSTLYEEIYLKINSNNVMQNVQNYLENHEENKRIMNEKLLNLFRLMAIINPKTERYTLDDVAKFFSIVEEHFIARKYRKAMLLCDVSIVKLPKRFHGDPYYIKLQFYRALCLRCMGKCEKSWLMYRHLYHQQIKMIGNNDENVSQTLLSMCQLSPKLHAHVHYLEQLVILVIERIESVGDIDHEYTLKMINELACGLRKAYKDETALELYDRLHLQVSVRWGIKDYLALIILLDKSQCLRFMQKVEDSLRIFEQVCLAVDKKVLPSSIDSITEYSRAALYIWIRRQRTR